VSGGADAYELFINGNYYATSSLARFSPWAGPERPRGEFQLTVRAIAPQRTRSEPSTPVWFRIGDRAPLGLQPAPQFTGDQLVWQAFGAGVDGNAYTAQIFDDEGEYVVTVGLSYQTSITSSFVPGLAPLGDGKVRVASWRRGFEMWDMPTFFQEERVYSAFTPFHVHQLATPQNIHIDRPHLAWNPVANATDYRIMVSDVNGSFANSHWMSLNIWAPITGQFDAVNHLRLNRTQSGTYLFKVAAVAPNVVMQGGIAQLFLQSEFSATTAQTVEFRSLPVAPNFRIDGTGVAWDPIPGRNPLHISYSVQVQSGEWGTFASAFSGPEFSFSRIMWELAFRRSNEDRERGYVDQVAFGDTISVRVWASYGPIHYTAEDVAVFYQRSYTEEITFSLGELDTPTGIEVTGDTTTWDAVSGATGYIVYKFDSGRSRVYLEFANTPIYTYDMTDIDLIAVFAFSYTFESGTWVLRFSPMSVRIDL